MNPPLPWARRDGRLSLSERWRLVLQALSTRITRRHRGLQPLQDDQRALACLALPGDAMSHALWDRAAQLQPEWLMQHALRAYAWGSLLALKDGLAHQPQTLFAACLLHDLGLTPAAAAPADACFAVRGAHLAQRLLREAGAGEQQAHRVACAIALHLDLHVSVETSGAEAHLLQAGTAFDVVGSRWRDLAPPLRDRVLAAHPRLGLKQALCTCMQAEARAAPHTRLGLYTRRLGFLDLIRRAPYDG
jgi:hypothetical protein